MNKEISCPGYDSWNVIVSYAVLRATFRTTFLFHGVTRFASGWGAFADQMVQSFRGTILPEFMVRPFATIVPPVEAIIGSLLLIGLFTRLTLVVGGLWMLALVLGATIRQDFAVVAMQLLYALLFFVLQIGLPFNQISVDRLCWHRRPE